MADNGESGMNYDNIFIRMLSRVGDAMVLSILFVLSCVPIITIGAAFTSLYYTRRRRIYLEVLYTELQAELQAGNRYMAALFSRIFHPVGRYLVLDDTVEGNRKCTREAVFVRECRASYPDSYDVYLYIRPAGEVR